SRMSASITSDPVADQPSHVSLRLMSNWQTSKSTLTRLVVSLLQSLIRLFILRARKRSPEQCNKRSPSPGLAMGGASQGNRICRSIVSTSELTFLRKDCPDCE